MNHLCAVEACDRSVSDGYACSQCTDSLARLLASVLDTAGHEGLATDLEIAVTRQARFAERRPRSDARKAPIPFDVIAAEARDVLLNTMTSWAGEIAGRLGVPAPSRTLPELATWLGRELGWIRCQPDGGQAIDELIAALRNARRAIDRPAELRYAGLCPAPVAGGTCRVPLYAPPGVNAVTCRGCGAQYDVDQRRAQLLLEADDVLLPATDVAQAISALGLALHSATVRKWAQRGHLQARGINRRRRPLYRLGDVRALAARRT